MCPVHSNKFVSTLNIIREHKLPTLPFYVVFVVNNPEALLLHPSNRRRALFVPAAFADESRLHLCTANASATSTMHISDAFSFCFSLLPCRDELLQVPGRSDVPHDLYVVCAEVALEQSMPEVADTVLEQLMGLSPPDGQAAASYLCRSEFCQEHRRHRPVEPRLFCARAHCDIQPRRSNLQTC